MAKSHQLPFLNSSSVSTSLLQLVHTDAWGPALRSAGGSHYYVSFIDDFGKFSWIYMIKYKCDVYCIFLEFQAHVEHLLGAKILTI
jgi:hypothetical protein